MSPTTKTEEPKKTLPIGHPQAGYVSPDLSFQDGTGTLPAEEQDFHDERDQAREDEIEAVAEAEDTAARAEAEATEEPATPAPKAKATTTKSDAGNG